MPFIGTIEDARATGKLKKIYKAIKKAMRAQKVPAIFQAFSIKPELLKESIRLVRHITFGGTSLGRRWEEMLSTAVSAWNHCHY